MANPTILEFKEAVAGQLGKSNANIVVTKRETAVKEAIRQYIGESNWRWNRDTATVTIVGGYGTLPTTLDLNYEIVVYRYVGTTKYEYTQVELDEIGRYSGGSYYYALDPANRRLYASDDAVLGVRFQKIPPTLLLDLTDDATTLPFPDKTTPVQLAIGKYWLAAERDEEEYDRFVGKVYVPLLSRDKKRDKGAGPAVVARPRSRRDLGWNRVRGI